MYYTKISELPGLKLEDKEPPFEYLRFREEIWTHLNSKDKELLMSLYYPIDIENLSELLIDRESKSWAIGGNIPRTKLLNGIQTPELLPQFFQDFLNTYPPRQRLEKKVTLINGLYTHYNHYCRNLDNEFVRHWHRFDQNLNNLIIYLNCHHFGIPAEDQIIGDYHEAEYLRQISRDQLDISDWDPLFRDALAHYDEKDIALREYLLDQLRWKYIDELVQPYHFTIEVLLAYVLKLKIVDRNTQCTVAAGKIQFEELLQELIAGTSNTPSSISNLNKKLNDVTAFNK
jgi:hypothetical protein